MVVDELKEYFAYDPETGIVSWARRQGSRTCIGTEAGTRSIAGYRYIKLKGKMLPTHRVAWALMTGEWPTQPIDHIDRVCDNNRWTNLRLATPSQNSINRRVHESRRFRGVVSAPRGNGHYVAIAVNCVQLHSDRYETEEEAARAYDTVAKLLHGEFAQLNFSGD